MSSRIMKFECQSTRLKTWFRFSLFFNSSCSISRILLVGSLVLSPINFCSDHQLLWNFNASYSRGLFLFLNSSVSDIFIHCSMMSIVFPTNSILLKPAVISIHCIGRVTWCTMELFDSHSLLHLVRMSST